MGKALYRKYRSRGFDEVVGQSHVTDLLKNAIRTGKIAHAYLLTGPRGVGKTSVARIIAHEVNGLEYSEDTHLDIIEIDAASNRRIDDIRDLREKVHIAPVSAKYKVYIIDEVHMLTSESFNALLKTLEEPPSHVIFILATTEVHKVPATIVSRAQRYHFRPATPADMVKHLSEIAKKENIPYEDTALELIAEHASGSFRDCVSLLDQLSGLSETITAELVESVLGMAPKERVDALVLSLVEHKTDDLLSVLDELQTQGISPVVLTSQLSSQLMKRAREEHGLFVLLDQLVDVPKSHDPQLKLITTLVKYTKPVQHKTVASHTSQKTLDVKELPKTLRANEQKKTAAQPAPAPEPPKAATTASREFNWDETLGMVKKHHAPLYSVLSRATHSFADNTLRLEFAYALHRKKLENPTSRNQLSSVLKDLFGLTPTIVIVEQGKRGELNATEQEVAAIMGGGEPVRATV